MNQAMKYEEYEQYSTASEQPKLYCIPNTKQGGESNPDTVIAADNFVHFCSTLAAIARRIAA